MADNFVSLQKFSNYLLEKKLHIYQKYIKKYFWVNKKNVYIFL